MRLFARFERSAGCVDAAANGAGRSVACRSRSRGFTLVEVVVAAGLLLFATSGIVPFFLGGLNQASTVRYKSIATNVARERMEEIRQLDYRDITDSAQLTSLFGATSTQRSITFDVSYDVATEDYEGGSLKRVTVTVGWSAPPKESSVSTTTLIHQQYLGSRGSNLEVVSTSADPLGTPFGLMDSSDHVRYHIAQLDWSLLFDDLSSPSTSKTGAYARLAFVDDYGQSIQLGREIDDYRIDSSYLKWATDGEGQLTDVYYQVAVSDLPFWDDEDGAPDDYGKYDGFYDGYWELQACGYNKYEQPGSTWRLRVRVENGRPDAPTQFTAVQADNQTVELHWVPGRERDRDHYVIERQWRAKGMNPSLPGYGAWSAWSDWEVVANDIPADVTYYKDQGDAATASHPWGSADVWSEYHYRIYAVDTSDPDHPLNDPPLIGKPYTNPDTDEKFILVTVPPGAYATMYTLNMDVVPFIGGTVLRDPSQASYLPGTAVTLTAVPNTGYEFANWSGDLSGTATPITVTMDASMSITANFTDTSGTSETYSVTITNDKNHSQAVTIKSASNTTVYTVTIAKNSGATADDLADGTYAISARDTTNGKVVNGSFTLPNQTTAVVLSLLK